MSDISSGDHEFNIKDILNRLSNESLLELIQFLISNMADARLQTIEWLKSNQTSLINSIDADDSQSLNGELIMEYWSEAQEIISEFNELGGGPEEKEDEVYDLLEQISELLEENSISVEIRMQCLDEAFDEYHLHNSGFDDRLLDIIFKTCRDKEDWEYLIKKLKKDSSSCATKLVMDINKTHLKNDTAYLSERLQNLESGMDYWDLVTYYYDRGDVTNSVLTAEKGIKKGTGRIFELLVFLAKNYYTKNDEFNLIRIISIANNNNEAINETMTILFNFYNDKNDYNKAKDILVESFLKTKKLDYYSEFHRIMNFLHKEDKIKFEEKVLGVIKKERLTDYLKITLERGWNDITLKEFLNHCLDKDQFGYDVNLDDIADKLGEFYPSEISNYYWERVYILIPRGNRGNYESTAKYLRKIKQIYKKENYSKDEWEKKINNLKIQNKRRKLLIELIRDI